MNTILEWSGVMGSGNQLIGSSLSGKSGDRSKKSSKKEERFGSGSAKHVF